MFASASLNALDGSGARLPAPREWQPHKAFIPGGKRRPRAVEKAGGSLAISYGVNFEKTLDAMSSGKVL